MRILVGIFEVDIGVELHRLPRGQPRHCGRRLPQPTTSKFKEALQYQCCKFPAINTHYQGHALRYSELGLTKKSMHGAHSANGRRACRVPTWLPWLQPHHHVIQSAQYCSIHLILTPIYIFALAREQMMERRYMLS